MAARPRDLRYGAAGALLAVAGLVASRCAGGACTSCLACAVPGAGLVLLALRPRRGTGPPAPEVPAAPAGLP